MTDPMRYTLILLALGASACAGEPAADGKWVSLFDGESLDGWTPKFRGFEPGYNHADTFRVQDGMIVGAYDGYESFDGRFGHLFYAVPYSRYRLRFEYRIFGEPAAGIPEWAFRNSGVMVHSPCPATMTTEQDFPISLEMQLLRGRGDGEPRTTGNLCTPGTEVVMDGETIEAHCIQSSSTTYDGDGWIKAEMLVLGDERIVHYIEGEPVLEYTRPTYGGHPAVNSNEALFRDGEPLTGGYIALQAEGHPVAFRNIELMNLGGAPDDPRFNCPDPDTG
ncbi:MAG TPA: DUF1080 domain-containing protein [Woeseiaceae bacterium]|nr:DUF1080 domain-containing protein [Woeseiaceae bacterium]